MCHLNGLLNRHLTCLLMCQLNRVLIRRLISEVRWCFEIW